MTQTHGSAPAPAPLSAAPSLRSVGLVFVGGAVGVGISTLLRSWGWSAWGSSAIPLALVNVAGALALGCLVGLIPDSSDSRRLLCGTGLLGGFTSFSAISAGLMPPLMPSIKLAQGSGPQRYAEYEIAKDPVLDYSIVDALGVSIASMAFGVLAAMLGLWLGGRLTRREKEDTDA